MAVLDTTIRTISAPATNRRGEAAGASWLLLLPQLDLERVVCLGLPSLAALKMLSRVSREVVLYCHSNQRQRAQTLLKTLGNDQVRLDETPSEFPEQSADLVYVVGANGGRSLLKTPLGRQIAKLLRPEGILCCEDCPLPERFRPPHYFPQAFWTTPWAGEVQSAVPTDEEIALRYFHAQELVSPTVTVHSFKKLQRKASTPRPASTFRWLQMPRQVATQFKRCIGRCLVQLCQHFEASALRQPLLGRMFRRELILARPGSASATEGPPQYLQRIAQAAGIDLRGYGWGLSAPGMFPSRKAVFLFFDRETQEVAYVAKLTRDPAFNLRIENEQRALEQLHALGSRFADAAPKVAFSGSEGGLAVVGETGLSGTPFRQVTTTAADCPAARAAVHLLTELGAATVAPATDPAEIEERLTLLYEQFVTFYRPADHYRLFLARQIQRLTDSPAACPTVFQHGDPGAWNALALGPYKVAFLDWEAAETEGMPLWDLFYFLRSYAMLAARAAGENDQLAALRAHLLAGERLRPLITGAVDNYCRALELPGQLVEPLFYTCWMHRAVKEATRIDAGSQEQGHYRQLLELCIEHRTAPTLQMLFRESP